MIHGLATIALGPVLLVQGRRVRRNTPRLPEPPGARSGREGASREGASRKGASREGASPSLRVLIAGDSAAAGVGAESQDDALSGQLVGRLRERFDVTWRLEAATGWTTARTVERLAALADARWDVLVTSLGVNDVTGGTSLRAWRDGQRALRSLARDRFGIRHFVVAGVPPMDVFPALPQPLRWYLGRRARSLNGDLERELASVDDADFIDLRFTDDATAMASDGFHPGPRIYAGWADRVADAIGRRWPRGTPG